MSLESIGPQRLFSPDGRGAGEGASLAQRMAAVESFLREEVCDIGIDDFMLRADVGYKSGGSIRRKLVIAERDNCTLGYGGVLTVKRGGPHVAIYAGEWRGRQTDLKHPELSWTLKNYAGVEGKTETEKFVTVMRSALISFGADLASLSLISGPGEITVRIDESEKQLRFSIVSGKNSRDLNGNVYLEDIPENSGVDTDDVRAS